MKRMKTVRPGRLAALLLALLTLSCAALAEEPPPWPTTVPRASS